MFAVLMEVNIRAVRFDNKKQSFSPFSILECSSKFVFSFLLSSSWIVSVEWHWIRAKCEMLKWFWRAQKQKKNNKTNEWNDNCSLISTIILKKNLTVFNEFFSFYLIENILRSHHHMKGIPFFSFSFHRNWQSNKMNKDPNIKYSIASPSPSSSSYSSNLKTICCHLFAQFVPFGDTEKRQCVWERECVAL